MKDKIYAGRAFSPHVISACSDPYWQEEPAKGLTEYIRADIAERYRAALNKARADLIGAVQRNDLDVNAMLRRINEALHPTAPTGASTRDSVSQPAEGSEKK